MWKILLLNKEGRYEAIACWKTRADAEVSYQALKRAIGKDRQIALLFKPPENPEINEASKRLDADYYQQ